MEPKENIPIETERKYIIRIPDIARLRRCDGYSASRIEQIYLPSPGPGKTHRIRRRLTHGKVSYTETLKTRISAMSCLEDEHPIDEETYKELKRARDPARHPVRKVRHTFYIGTQKYEIDVYPFRRHSCVLETEIPSESTAVTLPDFLDVVRDVTGDRRYSNAALARGIPEDWKEE